MNRSALQWLMCTAAIGCSVLAHAQSGSPPAEATLEGATIVGDRDLPIGLYISPWRPANPEAELSRPARQLDVRPQLLDPEVFARQIEYYDALDAATR
ncbi:MAG: hypothetical protein ABF296_09950 [Oceanococcaceae bacterium]